MCASKMVTSPSSLSTTLNLMSAGMGEEEVRRVERQDQSKLDEGPTILLTAGDQLTIKMKFYLFYLFYTFSFHSTSSQASKTRKLSLLTPNKPVANCKKMLT